QILVVTEVECLPAVALGLIERVQRRGTLAGFAERAARALGDRSDVHSRRPCELECIDVVMRDCLGVILRTTERLDPLGCAQMLLRSLGTWDLPVRNVADEQMLERELRFSRDRAAASSLYE